MKVQEVTNEIHGSMYNELGMLQLLDGKADEAAVSIEQAAELFPKFLLNLATSMSAQGNIAGAVNNLENALTTHPDDPVILGNLAGLKMREADSTDSLEDRHRLYREAESICRKVIENGDKTSTLAGEEAGDSDNTANRVNSHMNLSQLCAIRGDWDEAIEHGKLAIGLQLQDDNNPERFTGSVAAHFIGPDGIPKVSPREHHTGHLHFTLAHMLLHRVALDPGEHAEENFTQTACNDLRLAAHHMAEAIVKYRELAEKYGKSIEGVISIEEMVEHFESVLPIGTQIELTGLKDEAYNGKIGVVASALSNTGRLMIMLDSGKVNPSQIDRHFECQLSLMC